MGMGLENILRVNSFSAFQPYSAPNREEIVEEMEVKGLK